MRDKIGLDGFWDFVYSDVKFNGVPTIFPEKMAVPGCFDLVEPYCGKRGYAAYHKRVHCYGLTRLFIEGMGLSGKVYVDGKLIGECRYAYMPEEFIFDAGAEHLAEIVIILNNHFSSIFQGQFDFYGYGGIYGSVYAEKLPQNYLSDLFISTEDFHTGLIRICCNAADNYSGDAVLTFDDKYRFHAIFINGRLEITLSLPEFKLWNIENPNLHTVSVKTAYDEESATFGIRKFSVEGRKILLNEEPIKLFGYNRHESHPEFGAATPLTLLAADLRMLKSQGGNFIRGCHYPQRRSFLDLCDAMGIVVWEETLSWGIRTPELHTKEFLIAQIEQAEKLTRASFNHPCIAIRGFLNECDSSLPETRPVIKACYDAIRSIDNKCLISFASNRYEKCCCTDLVDVVAMNPYPGWYDSTFDTISTVDLIQKRLHEIALAMPQDKPYLITEIGCEALFGFRDSLKTRWSEEYQAEVMAEVCDYVLGGDECAGVAIWQFADTRSFVNGPGIYARARGFNNKGILDEYRRPKKAWDAITEILSKNRN